MKQFILVPSLVFASIASMLSIVNAAQDSSSAPRVLRILDVRDLLEADARRTASTNGDVVPAAAPTERNPARGEPAPACELDAPNKPTPNAPLSLATHAVEFQEVLERWMRPALDRTKDALQVTQDGTLIAHVTAEGQAWLDNFLALQRREPVLLDMQFCFLSGKKARFDALLPNGGVAFLTNAAAEKLIADSKSGNDISIMQAPRIVAWPRQKNVLSTLDQVAYVKEWRVETVEPDHQQIADPLVDVVQSGILIESRAVLLDEKRIGLETVVTQSDLKIPIATKKVKLAIHGGIEVEIGQPEVTTVSLRTTVMLESNSYALFRGPLAGGDRDVVVLLHATRVDGEMEAAPAKR
ncbi:MAG: hypothetical protein K8S98_07675 [Planctomycetes bacterium]|nr:hypothetical protein [Planctomycetota bacterium]